MSNGRPRLELSDAGSRFRVGDMKGRIRASTGKSTFKMVTVSLIWSVRMVGTRRYAINPGGGPHTLSWRTLRMVHWSYSGWVMRASRQYLDRAYELPQRLPQKVHWAWCITGGGAGGE